MAQISIVIPTQGNRSSLKRLLSSLEKSLAPLGLVTEVFVLYFKARPKVDGDGFKSFTLKLADADRDGVNHKRNLGIVLSRAPITFFLDDDCEVLSADFFRRHLFLHESQPQAFLIGGPYRNHARGYWARIYSDTQRSWHGFLGGNLSMKTAPTSPWIRFEEAIAFGGAETELVDRLRKIEPSYLHYDPELRVDHHVSLSWIGFLRKAYMQGRSAAILSGESSKAPMPPRTGSRGLYGLSFDTGRLIGWTYGRNRAPRSFILKALAFQFFGWPKLRVVTSEGRIHEPIVARQFAPVLSFLFTFFNQVKVSVFWRTFYPSFCRTWGLLQRFWASAAQFVFWDHIFPVWIFAKKRIFWDKMFPIWIFAKKRMFWDTIFPLWVITKKMVYWNGVFRIYVFFKSRAWRLKWAYWQVSALAGRTILKPYFFARYQFQKRIVKKEALR